MPASTRAFTFLVPGDWQALTGGYVYNRRIVAELRARGWTVDIASPGDAYPWPDARDLQRAQAVVERLPDGHCVVGDGLALGALPELVAQHARRLRWVALVHHPLALESGLTPAQQAHLFDSERRALAPLEHVIVTSASTGRALAGYGVAPERIAVVMPGTDRPVRPAVRTPGPAGLNLLCVATVTPRKGHAVLLQALAGLQDRDWHLHCIGSLQRDAATAAAAQALTGTLGLNERVSWHGEFDGERLTAHYAQADAFVLASYYEGYGMVLSEALAHGLPVVSCAAGAIVDTVPADAGVLVPPGDADALRVALARLMDDAAHRASLAAGAQRAAASLPSWRESSLAFEAALLRAMDAPAS